MAFSRFHVLYSGSIDAGPGRRYRQIVSKQSDDGAFYEVFIFGGDVIRTEPDFKALGDDAEYYTYPSQEAADKDADQERDRSVAEGWLIFESRELAR